MQLSSWLNVVTGPNLLTGFYMLYQRSGILIIQPIVNLIAIVILSQTILVLIYAISRGMTVHEISLIAYTPD